MRAIWKGAVSFGLVSVPVKLYAATECHDISFRQVHAKDGGRIKYQRVCSDRRRGGRLRRHRQGLRDRGRRDGHPHRRRHGRAAREQQSREIAVEKFVPSDQIDPMLFEKSYYLEPEKTGAKPYALLRQALLDADRMAVVTVALRSGRRSAVLRVRDDVIVMQTMMWPDEIRTPDFSVDDRRRSRPPRSRWPTCWSRRWPATSTPSEFEDDYAEAVEALVKTKIEGGEVRGRRPSRRRPPARSSTCWPRCSAPSTRPRPPAARRRLDEQPAKKTPAKKAPAKKAAAKKAPAKKATRQAKKAATATTDRLPGPASHALRAIPHRRTASNDQCPGHQDQLASSTCSSGAWAWRMSPGP